MEKTGETGEIRVEKQDVLVNWLCVKDCHPERSEGSRSVDAEMLRCAQHDKGTQHDKVPQQDRVVLLRYLACLLLPHQPPHISSQYQRFLFI